MWNEIIKELFLRNCNFIKPYKAKQNENDCDEVLKLLTYILKDSTQISNGFLKYFSVIDHCFD